ncbi:MAG: hypothetical protein EPN21_17530, partial [Methylococcaceae bacterium]
MRNTFLELISISLSRDRLFRSTPKIGHDLAKQPVTIDRNRWSRFSEMSGHDALKYALMQISHQRFVADPCGKADFPMLKSLALQPEDL